MTPHPDPLDPLLERWRETPPAPPSESLYHEVWRRIADAETSTEPTFLARLECMFGRASFACAFVVACMLLGLFLAEVRVSRQQARRNVELAQAYVHLIDPLLEPTGGHPLLVNNSRQP
jgi:hypothetical protein